MPPKATAALCLSAVLTYRREGLEHHAGHLLDLGSTRNSALAKGPAKTAVPSQHSLWLQSSRCACNRRKQATFPSLISQQLHKAAEAYCWFYLMGTAFALKVEGTARVTGQRKVDAIVYCHAPCTQRCLYKRGENRR